ncbi:MAG: PepSY-like domain-containing protein [Prevotella sp.]|nr:PepSY-like domain-containing protein [Prevotella sp.]
MKTKRLFLVTLLCLLMSVSSYADGRMIPVEKLPDAAKTFVAANFPGKKMIYAERDGGRYEVRLDDGTEIEFYRNGEWDKVDCYMLPVPAALIPETIKQYVKANFPDAVINKIDKERYGYEIELSNNLELKFNKQGMLMQIDH